MNTQANAMHNFVELMSLAQPTAQEPDVSLRPWSELTESMTAAVAHHTGMPVLDCLRHVNHSCEQGAMRTWGRLYQAH